MPENPPVRPTRDIEAIKVFTHPLRLRLLRLLRSEGPATASGLGRILGATPSLISYHLREMAKYGFIGEDPEGSADGRERRWRAENDLRFSTADFAGDEVGLEVADSVIRVMQADVSELFDKSLRHVRSLGPDWQDASFSATPAMRLSASELKALWTDLMDVVARYRGREGDFDPETGAARERVLLQLLGFPYEP